MLEKLKVWVLQKLLGNQLGDALSAAYKKVTGYKTQIVVSLSGLVVVLQITGVLTEEQAWAILQVLAGAGAVTFTDKLSRHKELIGKLTEAAKK